MAKSISGDGWEDYVWKGTNAYQNGIQISKELEMTHPYRLRIAQNYLVLEYEIMNVCEEGYTVTHTADDKAIKHVNELTGENYILQTTFALT